MRYLLFTGKNCSKCPSMKASMQKLGMKYDEISTDTDTGKMQSALYHVRCLPTLIITHDGKPLDSFPGALPIGKLEEIKKRYGGNNV